MSQTLPCAEPWAWWLHGVRAGLHLITEFIPGKPCTLLKLVALSPCILHDRKCFLCCPGVGTLVHQGSCAGRLWAARHSVCQMCHAVCLTQHPWQFGIFLKSVLLLFLSL